MVGIDKAVAIAGSQSELARRLSIRPQAVQQWVATKKPPVSRVPAIVDAVNGALTYHDLRPDVFPK